MAFDAPRKTLDEIRREIDEEFGPPAVTERPAPQLVGGVPNRRERLSWTPRIG